MSGKVRVAIAGLSLSASAFVGMAVREGYTGNAIIPTRGDVPTYGFGSTVRDDGSRVQMGDQTTPVKALRTALIHVQRDEPKIRACIGPEVKLHQAEYDIYVDLAYNIGTFNFCTGGKAGNTSTIVLRLRAEDYIGACNAIPAWKFAGGYDCSTPGNKICGGVWTDRLRQQAECLKAAS